TICSDAMSFFLIIATFAMMAKIILGSLANVFIVLVNFTGCIKRSKISLADRILTVLAIFRFGLLCIILMNWRSTVFNPALLTMQVKSFICYAWAITNHFNTWLATILSILYLLKIGNFSNLIFLGLKEQIKSVIVVVLLGSLVLLFPNLLMMNTCGKVQVNDHSGNLTGKTKLAYVLYHTIMMTFTLNNVIPFTISMICFLLLIYSLCKHLKTMKLYRRGCQDPSTMTHIKALQAVISFLFYMKSLDEPVHLICQVIGTLYPSTHSYILIWGNRKFKQALVLTMVQSLPGAILFAEFIFGITANGFIAVVNIMDLLKRRKISSVDQILTALAICRFTEFWFVFILVSLYNVWSDLLINEKRIKIITVLLTVSNHFNVWLATCLSIFYFLKIGNFFNSIFLQLKWRVNKVVSVTLLASLILLFSNIIFTNIQLDAWFDGFKSNMSDISSLDNSVQLTKIIIFTKYIFTFIPLTVSLMIFLLLITSLWRHLKIMQLSARESRHASTTAHIRALETVTVFLLLYAIVLLSFFVLISRFEILEKNMLLFYHQIIGYAHSSVHSCVLILADNKLRQASLKVLWWLRGKPPNSQPLGS
ncbi:hypothetical protein U0070_012849, partial [Myodes glareolus]